MDSPELDSLSRRLVEIAQSTGLRCSRTLALLTRSHERIERAQRAVAEARRAAERAGEGWASSDSLPDREARRAALMAEVGALVRLHEISTRFLRDGDVNAALHQTLNSVMALMTTGQGNLQLRNPETGELEIVAHHGFDTDFLDFFARVHTEGAACGVAMRDHQRIIVPDVTTHPIFAGRPALDVLLRAGVRSVQSTPMISSSGHPVGIVSTHFGVPNGLRQPANLRLVDLFARQAADLVEHSRTCRRHSV